MVVLVDIVPDAENKPRIAPDSWHRLELAVESEMAPKCVSGCLGWIRSVLETEGAHYKQVAVDVWRSGWTWEPSVNDAYLRTCDKLDAIKAEADARRAEMERRTDRQEDLFA